jgi:PhnB protein
MATKPIPAGCHAVTPYLTVSDAIREIEFLVKAFGAVERERVHRPDGKVMHAQLMVGDSLIMIGESPDATMQSKCTLYHYVPDCDSIWKQAVAAGGEVVNEVTDMFYGDRTGAVRDPSGNTWWIATHKEDLSVAQIEERAAAFYKQHHK